MLNKFYGLLFSLGVITMFFELGLSGLGIVSVVGVVAIYKQCNRI